MLIIWIPIGILILYVALHSFYLAVWDKKLSAAIYFTKRTVTEGDELTLVEEVANAKRIPLPVLGLWHGADDRQRLGMDGSGR